MAASPVGESCVAAGLTEQLPITTQATTSRVVISNDAVRVVVFAMDAGQELTEHAAPRPVVVQMLQGSMTFTVSGTTSQLAAGDVVYLAPDARHALVATTPARFALTLLMTPSA